MKKSARKKSTGTTKASSVPRTGSRGKLYTLQVFLISGPVPEEFAGKEISRTIQILGNQTLADLHEAIFDAYDREDEHMYEFQFGKGPHDPKGPRYTIDPTPPEGDVEETTLDSLSLEVGRAFGYWFDFGDDWMHQIDVVSIEDAPAKGKFPRVTARVGKSPPQYPDEEEEDDEEE